MGQFKQGSENRRGWCQGALNTKTWNYKRQDTAGWKGRINNGLAHQTKILNIHSNIKLQYLIKQDEKSLLNKTELRMILLVLYKQFLNIHSKKILCSCVQTWSHCLHAGKITMSLCAPCTLPYHLCIVIWRFNLNREKCLNRIWDVDVDTTYI